MLKDLAIESKIKGGGLKKWVKIRWYTMYDCIESVMHHHISLKIVLI